MHRPRTTAKQRLGRVRSASGGAAALFVAGAALATLQCDATPPTDLPNVLLITVDTLRADHLETYGYSRRTDPALRGLAMEGIVFDRARSQAPWTLPSMASLFTGLYPSEHGAIFADHRIRSSDVGLAEVMHEAGYRTVAVVSHDFVDSSRGFARGFERFDESQIRPEDAVTSMQITDAALRHLRDRPDERPTFLWTHYFDPHFSYVRHPEYGFADDYRGPLGKVLPVDLLNERADAAQRGGVPMASADVRYAIDVYDEEIAFTDGAIGALLDAARGFDPQRPLLVVFTADHGELFMEHGRFGHDRELYRALTHVPLVLGGNAIPPALRGLRVMDAVETRFVANTIATQGGRPGRFDGPDLLAVAEGTSDHDGFALSEGSYAWGDYEPMTSAVRGPYQLIRNFATGVDRFHDVDADLDERQDLHAARDTAPIEAALAARITAFHARVGAPPEVRVAPASTRGHDPARSIEMPVEERERLRALGYVEEPRPPP